nr:MAG TPA: hypothetical protein [Caudoviricetes sp.]
MTKYHRLATELKIFQTFSKKCFNYLLHSST